MGHFGGTKDRKIGTQIRGEEFFSGGCVRLHLSPTELWSTPFLVAWSPSNIPNMLDEFCNIPNQHARIC